MEDEESKELVQGIMTEIRFIAEKRELNYLRILLKHQLISQ